MTEALRQTTTVIVRPVVAIAHSNPVAKVTAVHSAVGLPGRDGQGSSGKIKIPFGFGDATPVLIAALPAATTVFAAKIVIQTPFNGVGAALQLGDAGQADRLFAANQNDPLQAAEYETTPSYTYTSSTQLLFTIIPGAGCTQGSGYVLLEI